MAPITSPCARAGNSASGDAEADEAAKRNLD